MKFLDIVKAYHEYEKELVDFGKPIVRHTEIGFWGTADMHDCHSFCKKLDLIAKQKRFLDLGCGDGRIVLIASLFTEAVGADLDKELVDKGLEIMKKLNTDSARCRLLVKNYCDIDFSEYDILFIYPDKPFELKLERKIAKECKGRLYVYSDIYRPKFLAFNKVIWVNQTPIKEYLCEIK
ncbi:class I SAM-dependent methyltransferase [Candidatus Woesearchaeota archaeon]|nr:class I SAM-dependent methyltransferase [Candidatus Woesearchaeota archaeon]